MVQAILLRWVTLFPDCRTICSSVRCISCSHRLQIPPFLSSIRSIYESRRIAILVKPFYYYHPTLFKEPSFHCFLLPSLFLWSPDRCQVWIPSPFYSRAFSDRFFVKLTFHMLDDESWVGSRKREDLDWTPSSGTKILTYCQFEDHSALQSFVAFHVPLSCSFVIPQLYNRFLSVILSILIQQLTTTS